MALGRNFNNNTRGFLGGNDICSKLILSIDWEDAVVGPIYQWPQSLKTTLSIILSSKTPMFMFWGSDHVQFYNEAFIPVLGAEEDYAEIMGACGTDLWKLLAPENPAISCEKFFEVLNYNKREEVCWTLSYSAVTDEYDENAGILITCFENEQNLNLIKKIPLYKKDNPNDLMKNHLAISNAEERLRLATEATGIGSWDIDLRNNTIAYSPTLMELFGLPGDTILTLQEIFNAVHPDDQRMVDQAFTNALSTGYYNYEARMIWPDGSLHWISTNGKVVFDAIHFPNRLLGTTVDITEKKVEQLQKNDFIAIASHELKTPLTSIKAYLQMLKSPQHIRDPKNVMNMALRAENQVNKMTKLVYSFLDMSRIESGHVDLCMEPFRLDELIKEVIDDYMIHTATHELVFIPGIIDTIEGDRLRIGQVIDNLVSNAIKYSPHNKKIEITSVQFGEEAIVSVKDFGIGIDAKKQEKIFERFYRAEDEQSRNTAGFGIGLYLCADIMKRHNGGIWMESEHGSGTTFHFSLPLIRS